MQKHSKKCIIKKYVSIITKEIKDKEKNKKAKYKKTLSKTEKGRITDEDTRQNKDEYKKQ